MAAALNWSKVRPSMVAVATRFRAPFKVQTSGRNSPVASANPATTPELSWVCSPVSVNTVPLVPSETAPNPRVSPRPNPAAMLSPFRREGHAVWSGADDLVRCGHPRHCQVVADAELDEITAIGVGRRVEVASARRVAAVGNGFERLAADVPGQPVVGKDHTGCPGGIVRLATGQPANLRHCHGCDTHCRPRPPTLPARLVRR